MKTTKSNILSGLTYALSVIGCLSVASCADNGNYIEKDSSIKSESDNSKYDENNYSFNTISLWGSEAAVVDKGDYYIFQGDIHLLKEDLIQTRGAARIDRRWPNNKVYYSVDGIPAIYTKYIYRAIEWIENGSYIDMVPRYNEGDYIQFNFLDQNEWSAYSDYVGRKGGTQTINLSREAIISVGTIAHEICHAIGMYHEMSRTDRDNYIRINFEGMDEDTRYQYKTYAEMNQNGVNVGSFDFGSIMMYSSGEVMYKLDNSYIRSQRDSLSNTDMLTLATLQPIGDQFKFFDPYGYNEPYDSDYEYRRTKIIQCPEGAKIDFKFQYNYKPTSSNLGGYTVDDFNVRTIISIINRNTNQEVYSKEIPLGVTTTWTDIYLRGINIPQGGFTTKVTLIGSVKGTSTSDKLNALKRVMYNPSVYLHLDKVEIKGVNKHIPNEFGNDDRIFTFISI